MAKHDPKIKPDSKCRLVLDCLLERTDRGWYVHNMWEGFRSEREERWTERS